MMMMMANCSPLRENQRGSIAKSLTDDNDALMYCLHRSEGEPLRFDCTGMANVPPCVTKFTLCMELLERDLTHENSRPVLPV